MPASYSIVRNKMKNKKRSLSRFVINTLLIIGGIFLCGIGVHEVFADSEELINEHYMEIRFQGLSENYDDYGGDYENSVPQGMAGNGNTVYLLKTRQSKILDDRSYIVKILNADSSNPKVILPANEVYVEHGNGMTFYNGYLYIASGDGCEDAVFKVKETNNSTEGWGPEIEWTYEYETPDFDVDTMDFDCEKLTVNGINNDEDIRNIAHYSGDFFIVCLKSSYSGSTNTLTYGVGPISGSAFTIQKRFTVTVENTFSDVQDIDYCDGYLWAVLYKHEDTFNNIHLIEIPTSYSALEDGKNYKVNKTAVINKNEAGRSGTKNEAESVYVNGSYIYTWSNIRTGWNETFCRYSRFPNGVQVTSVTAKSETSLEIKWNAAKDAKQYRIDRRIEGGEFFTVTILDSTKSSFIDTDLAAGTKYYYRVYGKNSAGTSPKRGGVFGVTKTAIPKVNSVTALSESELRVKWTAVTGAKKYIVCRKKENTGEGWEYYSRIAETTGTEYMDTGLEPNTTYYYGIVAVTETGVESGNPNENGNPGSDNRLSGTTKEAPDTEAPVVSGGYLSDLSETACRFNVVATDNTGIDHVDIHTWKGAWTAEGDTVYRAVQSGNTWYYNIPLNLADGKTIVMDARIYDRAGNQALLSDGSTVVAATVRRVTVNLDSNGGFCSEKSVTMGYAAFINKKESTTSYYKTNCELPVATRPGYSFIGWSSERNGQVIYAPGGVFIGTDDTVLYAVWEEKVPDFILPTSLQEIGEEAFTGGKFTYVRLPEGVKRIESRAFSQCKNLRYIYIPAGITYIAEDSFQGVSNITIYGIEGSYAEFFAHKYGYTFEALE